MKNETKNNGYREAIFLFVKISGWIIFPIVFALFGGQYLDKKFGTEPWIFICFAGFAFLLTCVGILQEVKRYQKKLEKINNGK